MTPPPGGLYEYSVLSLPLAKTEKVQDTVLHPLERIPYERGGPEWQVGQAGGISCWRWHTACTSWPWASCFCYSLT